MGSSSRYQTSFVLSAFGVKVGVRVNEANAFERVLPYLPVGWKTAPWGTVDRTYSIELDLTKSGDHRLYRDQQEIASCADEHRLLDTFESDITIHIAEMARERVFVHAGVVGWCGRAIVIPGRSFSGKTSLVAALVRAGAVYYSDEYAVFDRHGRVHPYARALHIRKSGESEQTKCTPEKLGVSVGKRPLPLGLVLATRYREGAHWRPRPISAGQGVLELLNNTVSARRDPEAALNSFQLAIAKAKVLRGVRGDAAEVAGRVLKEML